MSRKFRIPWTVLCFAMLVATMGYVRFLHAFITRTPRELIFLSVCAVLHLGFVATGLSVLSGAIRHRGGWALAWTLVLFSPLLIWADFLGYRWIGQHLESSLPILIGSMSASFPAMPAKKFLVYEGAAAISCGFLAAAWLLWRQPRFLRITETGRRPWIAALAIFGLLAFVANLSLPVYTSTKRWSPMRASTSCTSP